MQGNVIASLRRGEAIVTGSWSGNTITVTTVDGLVGVYKR